MKFAIQHRYQLVQRGFVSRAQPFEQLATVDVTPTRVLLCDYDSTITIAL
jgi:hypothetical protein